MDIDKIAEFWEKQDGKKVKCVLCPHYCIIGEGQKGKCGARKNQNGVLIAANYGCVTSIAIDPIEKKPLYHFQTGKKIVSIGSFGCNLKCQFCQNYNISMEYHGLRYDIYTPELIAKVALLAKTDENVGIAYTYNEPLIGYEFVKECSQMIKTEGLMNVLVTNGYINDEPLEELLPFIDALNIDIKGNHNRTYEKLGGTQEPVKNTIKKAVKMSHVEVTTLVIPGENENEVEEIAKWLSEINPQIPYHLSRFFPRYKYSESIVTPSETMYKLEKTAEKYLETVHLGNM